MKTKAENKASVQPRRPDVAPYVLTVGAVLLAWQIAAQPFMMRAPVDAAIRIAPGSPMVLRRAAEAELTAGRNENAAELGRDALVRSPFDVRALRVVGLTEARAGRVEVADEILTLAGNWSLRDDPAHAWLVEHRLRQGDYASAFAHADTLARRREDIRPAIFNLFQVAGSQDPQRSLPVIASLVTARPPWRQAFLSSLLDTADGLQVAANLSVMLQSGSAPLTDPELSQFYLALFEQSPAAVRAVQVRLNRPRSQDLLANGGFGAAGTPEPFQWRLTQGAGVSAEIVADDLRPGDAALRVEYDGYEIDRVAQQLTFLAPGYYQLSGEARSESGSPSGQLAWRVACATGGTEIARMTMASLRTNWQRWSMRIVVPPSCPVQWLRLETVAGDRRSPSVVWFDRITVAPTLTGPG